MVIVRMAYHHCVNCCNTDMTQIRQNHGADHICALGVTATGIVNQRLFTAANDYSGTLPYVQNGHFKRCGDATCVLRLTHFGRLLRQQQRHYQQ